MNADVSREELMHKISDLEADRLELIHAHESDRIEFNRIIKEIKDKASSEVLEVSILAHSSTLPTHPLL